MIPVCVFINCKDCVDLLRISLPPLLVAQEIVIADASVSDGISEYINSLESHIKYYAINDEDYYGRYRKLKDSIKSEYILWVDTDEIYPASSLDIIAKALESPSSADGYLINQHNFNYGESWGKGTPWIRLFRNSRVVLPSSSNVHELLTVDGRVEQLDCYFDHINNPRLSIAAAKSFRYASMSSVRKMEQGKQLLRLDQLPRLRLVRHFLVILLRCNIRLLKHFFLSTPKNGIGFASLCFAYSEAIRVFADDVADTELIRMESGQIEKGTRGYF